MWTTALIELRPNEEIAASNFTRGVGFLLPPEQIIPLGEEIWEFFKVRQNQSSTRRIQSVIVTNKMTGR